jgi:hypothetical protein
LSVALEKRNKPLHHDCYATEDELVGTTKREEVEAMRSRAVLATVKDACVSIQKVTTAVCPCALKRVPGTDPHIFRFQVSSGGPAWVQQLLGASVLPPLYHHLQSSAFDIQCLTALCICNLLRYGTAAQRSLIVQQAAIPQLLAASRLDNVDVQRYVLHTILGLLEEPFT